MSIAVKCSGQKYFPWPMLTMETLSVLWKWAMMKIIILFWKLMDRTPMWFIFRQKFRRWKKHSNSATENWTVWLWNLFCRVQAVCACMTSLSSNGRASYVINTMSCWSLMKLPPDLDGPATASFPIWFFRIFSFLAKRWPGAISVTRSL